MGVRIRDKPEWSSTIDGDKAEVGIADTQRHLQAFAHELLHLRLSARGYRHILGAGNHDSHQQQIISALLHALDNELQRHRMFPDFVDAGFDGGDFYAESDDDVHTQLQDEIKELHNGSPAWKAVLSYFTLIAPGGQWPEGKREELVALLRSKVSSDTRSKLAQVKALFAGWRQQVDLDPTETIVSIFETLGGFEGTYLAEDVAAYPAGSFIPRDMTPDEFMAIDSPMPLFAPVISAVGSNFVPDQAKPLARSSSFFRMSAAYKTTPTRSQLSARKCRSVACSFTRSGNLCSRSGFGRR